MTNLFQIHRMFSVAYDHRIYFTRSSFRYDNKLLLRLMQDPSKHDPVKVLVVVDKSLVREDDQLVSSIYSYFETFSKDLSLVNVICLPGGEVVKNGCHYSDLLYDEIEKAGLCRHSYVIGMGGGALLDLVGFVSATAHRGIRHLRMPTTTLSQGDGGVGVKNAINFKNKKNFIGTFAPPFAIVNDFDFLTTLPQREKRAGFAEAIKVALIKDEKFFEWIKANVMELNHFEQDAVAELVKRSASLHVEHIVNSGDPFENGSARPLDFGHWSAHKLEQLSEFKLGHGDAVAIGIALDAIYCHLVGKLGLDDVECILNLLENLGFPLFANELSMMDANGKPKVLIGLEEFQEHIGGKLTITLIEAIGQSYETNVMEPQKILEAIAFLKDRQFEMTTTNETYSCS